ncbi:unnamed protein product [Ilex paraguariensis]|uniref:HMA domain-containing protein n=1 Tax=Ilex paraguariensis TaxID=185542 RepID=A0ABC8UMC7_9AQUA
MAEKVTIMVLKVDLQCPHCRKKIKKILCKFPQIRDQTYDEKHNTVTIKVVCCSPEKIRDKLCCKGGKTIKSIDILPPLKPKPPEKPKETEKPKPPEKPKETPKETPKGPRSPKRDTKEPPKAPAPLKPHPPPMPEPVSAYPIRICCGPCSEGRDGGPCYHGYGVPPPPPPGPCYDGYGYYGGYGRGYCGSRGDCFSDENPSACTIM